MFAIPAEVTLSSCWPCRREPGLAKPCDWFVPVAVIKTCVTRKTCMQSNDHSDRDHRSVPVTMTALAWRTIWSSRSKRGRKCKKLIDWLTDRLKLKVSLKLAYESWRNGNRIGYFRLVGEMGICETGVGEKGTGQTVSPRRYTPPHPHPRWCCQTINTPRLIANRWYHCLCLPRKRCISTAHTLIAPIVNCADFFSSNGQTAN